MLRLQGKPSFDRKQGSFSRCATNADCRLADSTYWPFPIHFKNNIVKPPPLSAWYALRILPSLPTFTVVFQEQNSYVRQLSNVVKLYSNGQHNKAWRNMSIISKVDKHRSLSIEYDTNLSTNIGNR